MARLAGECRMLALQYITRAVVVESCHRRFPMNDRKVPAVVLGMACGTRRAGLVVADERWMQAALFLQPDTNLLVALDAFIFRRTLRQIVAARAVGRPVDGGVGTRQGPGRYLGMRARHAD